MKDIIDSPSLSYSKPHHVGKIPARKDILVEKANPNSVGWYITPISDNRFFLSHNEITYKMTKGSGSKTCCLFFHSLGLDTCNGCDGYNNETWEFLGELSWSVDDFENILRLLYGRLLYEK
jgi:hypothetical protein